MLLPSTPSSSLAVDNVSGWMPSGDVKSQRIHPHSQNLDVSSRLVRYFQLAFVLSFGIVLSPGAWALESVSPADPNWIVEAINTQYNPLVKDANFSKIADELKALYGSNQNQLLWLNAAHDQQSLQSAVALLDNAGAQGLNPVDYDVQALKKVLPSLTTAQPQQLAYFDAALSAAMIRYLHDLHEGRVTPQALNYSWKFNSAPMLNAAQAIQQAVAENSVAQLAEKFEPKIKQYQLLKIRLADFRRQSISNDGELLRFDKALRPNERYPQLDLLKKRLQALEILPEAQETPATYQGALVDGIRQLQQKHGLKADGIIGRDTAVMLTQNHTDKIKQIELAMERLRWLPQDLNGPLILVNIPAFELSAFNSLDQESALNMKVIVGKAPDNQTPMLFEDMEYIEFKPYWNIPKSIMDKEILPKLVSNWGYLQNQNIELVQRGNASDAVENIFDDLRQGRVRARQRPGNKNPLGKVKFVFPNKADVYLHDTPSHNLFTRDRRDFSHGCVRVAEADKLAEFVLSFQSGWDSKSIKTAMEASKTQRVRLKQAIPVLFFYTTSFVDENNHLHFYHDIYGQNETLEKALKREITIPSQNESVLTAKNVSSS